MNDSLSDLERAYDLALEGFGDALELRDAETAGHSKRVTAYVIAMARKMGLNKNEISVVARGAFLHDIGKMAIPDGILRKPGALTPDETLVMREHCLRGYEMLKKIPFLAEAAEIVYSHQERYDGSGYPRGLKGKELPLGARLVAVANTLDSITSDLPYRAAQSFSAASEEIRRRSGRQFDPEIVSIFLDVPDKVWEDLRSDIAGQVKPKRMADPERKRDDGGNRSRADDEADRGRSSSLMSATRREPMANQKNDLVGRQILYHGTWYRVLYYYESKYDLEPVGDSTVLIQIDESELN